MHPDIGMQFGLSFIEQTLQQGKATRVTHRFQLTLGYSTDASRSKIGVTWLDAAQTAQVLIARLQGYTMRGKKLVNVKDLTA